MPSYLALVLPRHRNTGEAGKEEREKKAKPSKRRKRLTLGVPAEGDEGAEAEAEGVGREDPSEDAAATPLLGAGDGSVAGPARPRPRNVIGEARFLNPPPSLEKKRVDGSVFMGNEG